ncbi:FtsH protease activity modulator HflK [bacterium]|nr:FtsH protease activity modulator HflK [bacterium]
MPDFKTPLTPQKVKIILGIVVLIWFFTGVYKVDESERGVVLRFGKLSQITNPGINYHLPFPIESVTTPKVTEVKRIEIGFRTIDDGPPATYQSVPGESKMLTGDENIINAEVIVQYRISDPANYLFKVNDITGTLVDVSESALRQVIGSRVIDEALTDGKYVIQEETKKIIQEILNSYEAGIFIETVQLQDVNPPEEVIAAFKDVASAREEKQRVINEAEGYRSDIVPKARGKAEQEIVNAEAYKAERIAIAEGEAEKFNSIYQEYAKSKNVTKTRLYIESMEKVLPQMKKTIIDKDAGVLNVLPLKGGISK